MAGNLSKVWASQRWSVSAANQSIGAGRGEEDGEFLRIEKSTKKYGYKGSGSGEGTWFRRGASGSTVTMVLPQTSSENDKLYAIFKAQELADAPFPFSYADEFGNSKMAGEAMLEDLPDETVSVEPGTLEWVFLVHDPARQVGGH